MPVVLLSFLLLWQRSAAHGLSSVQGEGCGVGLVSFVWLSATSRCYTFLLYVTGPTCGVNMK
jgi:hypothetical protein